MRRRQKGARMVRHDIEFDAEGALLRGWFYPPDPSGGPAPCVVMAHGWTSTKRMYLDRFAEVFAAAGLAVLRRSLRRLHRRWLRPCLRRFPRLVPGAPHPVTPPSSPVHVPTGP